MRWAIVLLTLVGAAALAAPAALATSATGSGGGLIVTVELSDTAAAGAPFTVAESIRNTTGTTRIVRVTQTLAGPNGTIFSVSYPLLVPAGKTLAFRITYTFPSGAPPGTYFLTLAASTAGGTASATATTVVP